MAPAAIADSTTLEKARDAKEFLANNDSYNFFEKVNGLVKTGPTGTNVMDVRIFLVGPLI